LKPGKKPQPHKENLQMSTNVKIKCGPDENTYWTELKKVPERTWEICHAFEFAANNLENPAIKKTADLFTQKIEKIIENQEKKRLRKGKTRLKRKISISGMEKTRQEILSLLPERIQKWYFEEREVFDRKKEAMESRPPIYESLEGMLVHPKLLDRLHYGCGEKSLARIEAVLCAYGLKLWMTKDEVSQLFGDDANFNVRE